MNIVKKEIYIILIDIYMYLYNAYKTYMVRGNMGSISGRVTPKTQKMILDASLLNTQFYMVRIKGKVVQSRKRIAPFATLWCCRY